jgi:hypothetical protein
MRRNLSWPALTALAAAVTLALVPPASAQVVPNTWSGTWSTNYGTMTLTQSGNSVKGTYTYDDGHLSGTLSLGELTGRWDEAPTRAGPNDAGPFRFVLVGDGKSFSGDWRHDGDPASVRNPWNGTCTSGECLKNVPHGRFGPFLSPKAKKVGNFMHGGNIYRTMIVCAGTILGGGATPAIPFLAPFVGKLGFLCATGAALAVTGEIILGADPPDANYDKIVLPRALPLPPASGSVTKACSKPRGRACKRLARAMQRYLGATSDFASMMEGMAITANRFLTAGGAGDGERQLLQSATSKVYFGAVAYAQRGERAAGRSLAESLKRAGVDVVLSPEQLSGLAPRLDALEGVPPSLLARLNGLGVDAGSVIRQTLRAGIDAATSQGVTLDLQSALRQPIETGGFLEEYRAITTFDVARMVTALEQQRILSNRLSARLIRDLNKARRAKSSIRRARAIRKFRKRLSKLRSPYSGFLRFAVLPLARR